MHLTDSGVGVDLARGPANKSKPSDEECRVADRVTVVGDTHGWGAAQHSAVKPLVLHTGVHPVKILERHEAITYHFANYDGAKNLGIISKPNLAKFLEMD